MQPKILGTFFIILFILSACSPSPASPEVVEPALEHKHMSDPTSSEHEQGHETQKTSSQDRSELACIDKELFCIGLVTAVGKVNDNSFNQAVWEGVRRAQVDLLAHVEYIETTNSADVSSNIELFVDQGYDVIVTMGSSMNVATKRAAEQYTTPHFIGVDQTGFDGIKNATGLVFPNKKIGFMAGSLAASVSKTGVVGVVLPGARSPEAIEIREGFEAGAFAISSETVVLAMHHPNLTIDSVNDPMWGAEAAREMLGNGADVIFSGGGPTGNGALAETATVRGVYCIGIGTDQWIDMPDAQPCLINSVIKQLENSVFDVLARTALDQSGHEHHPSGNFNGKIGLASYHDFSDVIPADLKAMLVVISEGLSSGEIAIDGSYIHLHQGGKSSSEEGIIHIHDESSD